MDVWSGNVQLWDRLSRYKIEDHESKFTIVDRMCRENMWDYWYAMRVVQEYMRFCFLAAEAGHTVTPSTDVDIVWHTHLLYTRDYEEFCDKVLQYKLHHGPTKGGKQENDKFEDLYERTLESYRRIFREEPPKDIWKPSQERFSERLVTINLHDHLVINVRAYPVLSRIIKGLLRLFV